MGKKVTSSKLTKPQAARNESMLSVFNRFANQLTESKKRKIEKLGDTKQRLMEAKKSNKFVKVSKKTTKFALIEDGQGLPEGMTHRGKNIGDLQQFNDMNFENDVEDEQFLKAHENLNFTGFEQEQRQADPDPERPKSKSEVYKQIIEKSKLHKHLRQQVYEQNLEKAVELDNQFPHFISKLQLRNRDSNVRQKMEHLDHEFEKLASQLKDDERVVSNRVIEKNQKYTETMKKKKNQQLNQLMKDSDDEEDIRGWIKGVNQLQEQEQEQEQDEIDEVQLSSGDEGEGREQEEDEEEEEDEDDEEDEEEEEDAQSEQEDCGQNDQDQEQEEPQIEERDMERKVGKVEQRGSKNRTHTVQPYSRKKKGTHGDSFI